MDAIKQLDPQISVGPQPGRGQLAQFQKQGIRSIVNFRHEGEDQQPLSPPDEGRLVAELGMSYLHVPVSLPALTPAQVDQFRRDFRALPRPVFAHCKLGTRAGLMMLMQLAIEHGLSGDEAVQQAEALGFAGKESETRHFIRDYVDSRSHARAARH